VSEKGVALISTKGECYGDKQKENSDTVERLAEMTQQERVEATRTTPVPAERT
jgi:hypothetical protein